MICIQLFVGGTAILFMTFDGWTGCCADCENPNALRAKNITRLYVILRVPVTHQPLFVAYFIIPPFPKRSTAFPGEFLVRECERIRGRYPQIPKPVASDIPAPIQTFRSVPVCEGRPIVPQPRPRPFRPSAALR